MSGSAGQAFCAFNDSERQDLMSNGPEGEKNSPLKPGAGSPHILSHSSLSLTLLTRLVIVTGDSGKKIRASAPQKDHDLDARQNVTVLLSSSTRGSEKRRAEYRYACRSANSKRN